MGGIRVGILIGSGCKRWLFHGATLLRNPLNLGIWHVVKYDGVHGLDLGQGGQLGHLFLGFLSVVQMNRNALEELIVELHSRFAMLGNRLLEGGGILGRREA